VAPAEVQVAFVMPSKYTAQNIPKPKNAKVEIKPIEAHTLAALSFRWLQHPHSLP
jgi:SOUL heme-binding protein